VPHPALDVSVVIPAYQRADLVARSVLSAQQQQPAPAREIIVVDDGSTDGTGDVAARYGATVLRQPNGGEGAARNAGLAAATSTWVALLDSDDAWLPHHLDRLFAHADGQVLVSDSTRSIPSGRLEGTPSTAPVALTPASILWPNSPIVPSACMVRRQEALDVGGFRALATAADLDFFIRILERGPGVALPDVTALYFLHEAQVSSDNASMKAGRLAVLREYADRPWFPAGVLDKVAAGDTWDALRLAQRQRDGAGVARATARLLSPASCRAVTQLLAFRRRVRRR